MKKYIENKRGKKMRKFKYLIQRIIHLDYKNMFKIASAISKKTGKNQFILLLDIIYCGIAYQARIL